MSWWCLLLFSECVLATFPPVSNPPPIPNQGVRTVDISRQFYVQDDLQINPPVVKEEGYLPPLPPDPKVDDQRWFVYENQSGEPSDLPSSTETFDRYYSNGLPAVGPVATPVPDDSYLAQPSGTSKVLPNSPVNARSSDVWVLVKGPDDQYVPQRLVQVQYPQERISQVVSADFDPQIPPVTAKSVIPPPVKTSDQILPQVWVRQQSQVQQQNVYQDSASNIVSIPVAKQNIDYSPQAAKQYIQTDVPQIQQQTFLPQQSLSPKTSDYVLPLSLPSVSKGGVINPAQQNAVVNQPVIYKGADISSPKQPVLVQGVNYKGVDVSSPDLAEISQPINYKGVDLASPNPPIVVNQQVNYKGVDSGPPTTGILVNQPDNYRGVDLSPPKSSFLVNQPDNYKGIDITPLKQTVVVNQPADYKGADIPPTNQDIIINQKSNYKGIDNFPNQATIINQPDTYKSGYISAPKQVSVVTQPQLNVPFPNVLPQVRHIWIPTSAQTGKFITVPVTGSIVDSGKTVPSKGAPINVPQPISVSGTWVLKQDGSLPRFEPQGIVSQQVVQNAPLGTRKVIMFRSPNNAPVFGNFGNSRVPVDVWANSKDFRTPPVIAKSIAPALPLPSKSEPVVVGKSGQVVNISPQKTFFSTNKGFPPQPRTVLPSVVSPVVQISNGKPCLTVPQKPIVSPKIVPYPIYRPSIAVNRQTLPRILRLNRHPFGSYYVLNPKIGPSLYAYPRPQASYVQQTKNGLVRILPAKQFNIPSKQLYYTGPRRQVALPVNQIKTISQVLPPQFAFPAVQAFNRLRYAYPQTGFLRSLPATGKNVFIFPPNIKKKSRPVLKASSSESSSSESSSSESKSAENKSKLKSKEEIGESSKTSAESAEASKSERETEDVEAAASEPEPESKEASEEAAPVSEASENPEEVDSEANSAS
ncbi:hypothetical protein JTE90_004230 [Oedothorax gibbosus]|uniref:Uncharacterized protein n=1 Tax=Oedothorax gibbosus TaxID=931172 RepID=A0AAV6UQ26_9ARAC|nr:hypothetical protein JTE90_004230 [Oedothorax gibbosus]